MTYEKITPADIQHLLTILPPERLLTGDGISEDYSHDELAGERAMPEAVARVTTVGEVSAILAYANSRRIPVVARGSGTGLCGGSIPIMGGIVIETVLMNEIRDFDPENLIVTVEPGALLMEVQAFAADHGCMYPPDPGEKTGSIGGNISTNAGGMRAVKYGVTRDYVRALKVVLADGSIQEFGGKVVKNSSGYALKDLIIGSEGTLGVVVEATLKLIPMPAASVSLLVPFLDMEAALACVPKLLGSGLNPTAIEIMDRAIILFSEEYLGRKFPDKDHVAYLLVTFDGPSQAEVDHTWQQAAELCVQNGATDALIMDTEERQAPVWAARGAFLNAIKGSTTELDECDVAVPRTKMVEFVRYTQQLEREYGVRVPSFGHAGDGNLHVYICRDDLGEEDWKRLHAEVFDLLYQKAFELGGLTSGEHGIGLDKRPYLARQIGEAQLDLMRGIKSVFDPNHILNPGKIF